MSLRRRRQARSHAAPHAAARPAPHAARDLRDSGPSQDNALYNCECGFVFQAPVLTSVDCPHCGGAQAW